MTKKKLIAIITTTVLGVGVIQLLKKKGSEETLEKMTEDELDSYETNGQKFSTLEGMIDLNEFEKKVETKEPEETAKEIVANSSSDIQDPTFCDIKVAFLTAGINTCNGDLLETLHIFASEDLRNYLEKSEVESYQKYAKELDDINYMVIQDDCQNDLIEYLTN